MAEQDNYNESNSITKYQIMKAYTLLRSKLGVKFVVNIARVKTMKLLAFRLCILLIIFLIYRSTYRFKMSMLRETSFHKTDFITLNHNIILNNGSLNNSRLNNGTLNNSNLNNSSLNNSRLKNGSLISKQSNIISSKLVLNSFKVLGMPDPCAKPRQRTGVEDLLCMQPPQFLPNYKNPCWIDRNMLRCLPYFHLFGICKSGTSDLFKRIHLHPEIVPNKGIFGKEVWYWSQKRFHTKQQRGIGMTLREFTDQFYAHTIQKNVTANGYHQLVTGHGDPMDFWNRFNDFKTPQNSPWAEELLWTTPYVIRHINPNVKLLLMLRDPVDRLFSHYLHSKAGTSAQSFDEHVRYSIPLWKKCLQRHTVRSCIYNPDLRLQLKAPIYTSFYVVHLREWLKVFPRKQIMIFRYEDYTKDIRRTLKSVFQFLEIASPNNSLLDTMVGLPQFYVTKIKSEAGPILASTRRILVDLYKPFTEELAVLLGDDRFAFRDGSFA